MKKIKLLMIIMALALITFGCSPKNPVEEPNVPIEEPTNPIDEPIGEPVEEPAESLIIEPTEKLEVVDSLTVLDEFEFDFDQDGEMEMIKMVTAAGRGPDGEIAWDDGQKWMLVVQDTEKDYVLLDEYVQLGSIDFFLYTIEDTFYIATISPRTASLTLNLYEYDMDNDNFKMSTPFNTSGNVNMIRTSGY